MTCWEWQGGLGPLPAGGAAAPVSPPIADPQEQRRTRTKGKGKGAVFQAWQAYWTALATSAIDLPHRSRFPREIRKISPDGAEVRTPDLQHAAGGPTRLPDWLGRPSLTIDRIGGERLTRARHGRKKRWRAAASQVHAGYLWARPNNDSKSL